jgi:hypothetical protein
MSEITLREFVERLWAEPVHEPPVHETWKETIARIASGGNQQVAKDVYFHLLEILPPRFQWNTCFAFCEGREPIKLFDRKGGTYLCRQLTWEQTVTFCRLAAIPCPSEEPMSRRLFLFVGERRSPTAVRLGVSWGDGRLAAAPLFEALDALGVCPSAQLFTNLFPDEGPLVAQPAVLEAVRTASRAGLTVVALGRRVARALEAAGPPYVCLIHPAARGLIRKRERYLEHVRERLTPLMSLKGGIVNDHFHVVYEHDGQSHELEGGFTGYPDDWEARSDEAKNLWLAEMLTAWGMPAGATVKRLWLAR